MPFHMEMRPVRVWLSAMLGVIARDKAWPSVSRSSRIRRPQASADAMATTGVWSQPAWLIGTTSTKRHCSS